MADTLHVRFERLKGEGWQPHGPMVRATPGRIAQFLEETGDSNEIHQLRQNKFFEGPIVPGLFVMSRLPQLFPRWKTIFAIEGHAVVFYDLYSRFRRALPFGAGVHMRVRASELTHSAFGPIASFEYEITECGKRPAISGLLKLCYKPPRRSG